MWSRKKKHTQTNGRSQFTWKSHCHTFPYNSQSLTNILIGSVSKSRSFFRHFLHPPTDPRRHDFLQSCTTWSAESRDFFSISFRCLVASLIDILSGIYFDILSGTHFDILSGMYSGIVHGILSDILSGVWLRSGNAPGSSSARWDLALAAEAPECPQRPGAGGSGWCPGSAHYSWSSGLKSGVPTLLWSSQLRSGSAHCDLELAVGVRQRGARCWEEEEETTTRKTTTRTKTRRERSKGTRTWQVGNYFTSTRFGSRRGPLHPELAV